jgi:2,3-bisphosphoglycerate-independent phosphoglycerate mutase
MYIGGGLNGIMDPVEPGLGCGSDTAHMSILGYDPKMLVLSTVYIFFR